MTDNKTEKSYKCSCPDPYYSACPSTRSSWRWAIPPFTISLSTSRELSFQCYKQFPGTRWDFSKNVTIL